ncbi:unnamed protein product [Cunninghamella echinulata]
MSELLTYVSGYTNKEGKGIYSYTFNTETGLLSQQILACECIAPSYFVIHQQSEQLFAVQETTEYQDKKETGGITAYRRCQDKNNNTLERINSQPSGGEDPCYIYVHGHHCLVANYSGGTVKSFPISKEGLLGGSSNDDDQQQQQLLRYQQDHGIQPSFGNPSRQEACHAHSIDIDPFEYKHALVMDLGADLALLHRYDHGKLDLLSSSHHYQFPKGTGPRHLVFSPIMRHFIYVLGELSNQIFMLEFNTNGGNCQLNLVQQINALPDVVQQKEGWLGAEIRITPNGKFLYATVRGHDSISVFYIDERTGKLKYVDNQSTRGEHPRYFIIDPNGNYLLVANQFSNNIVTFKIDQDTGKLSHVQTIEHPEPTCIQFWQ